MLSVDLAHAQEHDLLCEACNSGASHKPNEIVICDKCGRGTWNESVSMFLQLAISSGYHQRCHKPRIDPRVLMPDIDWICWKCTHGEVQSGTYMSVCRVPSC